ncbi:IIGP1-like protein, partial [Mya arenaria]
SGSGKSSLINAILNLTADDEGSASVGVTETTDIIVDYMNPKHPNLIFWDFPGVGTIKYAKTDYFDKLESVSKKKLSDFDFFLIISNNRFTENDLWFAKEIQKQKQHFFFCRTHTDDNKTYDFEHLMAKLIDDAPNFKTETLILSLSSVYDKIIDEKVKILKERIHRVALRACVGNIIPIPGAGVSAEAAVIFKEANFYREQLGIDDTTLTRICSDMNIDLSVLQE